MRISSLLGEITVVVVICCCSLPVQGKYGGGTGVPNDPYQIRDANHMQAIGADSNDWDKHFKLMADIDLGGYTGTSFNIIGSFSGVFDGSDHTISNFTYESNDISNIGLFGYVYDVNALIKDLGLINPNIDAGTGSCVGSLVGWLFVGNISECYVNGGSVSGNSYVGGIVGKMGAFMPPIPHSKVTNCYAIVDIRGDGDYIGGIIGGHYYGRISACYAAGNTFSSGNAVGGLVGLHQWGTISNSHAAGTVVGINEVGGLVGLNTGGSGVITSSSVGSVEGANAVGGLVGTNSYGTISDCYATGSVSGTTEVGGLLGHNVSIRIVSNCYSTGSVVGANDVGGLIGTNELGAVVSSFWDIETSGLNNMCGGQGPDGSGCDNANGKTTGQMQTESTFTSAGWDFVGETANGTEDIWKKSDGPYYPTLSWEKYWEGTGMPNNPYLIYNANQMNAIGGDPGVWDKHFKLMADIDLSGFDGLNGNPSFNIIGNQGNPFHGVFNGNNHTITNFTYNEAGQQNIGLFGYVTGSNAHIKNLGLITPEIDALTGGYHHVGTLVGYLSYGASITDCYVEDCNLHGYGTVGGLLGKSWGQTTLSNCYLTGTVIGTGFGGIVGGFVADSTSTISNCYSTANVSGDVPAGGMLGSVREGMIFNCYFSGSVVSTGQEIGGLIGTLYSGTVTNSYSTGSVSGGSYVGGLVGFNNSFATISRCYSTGSVIGTGDGVGGLVGTGIGTVEDSFWDIQTSGQANSYSGTAKTTEEMQTESTFTSAGWDFVGESANGTQNIWRLCEDTVDYPRLAWEFIPADFVCPDGVEMRDFAILGAQWQQSPGEPSADVAHNGGDGLIDRFDLAELVDNWLTERDVLLPGQASNPYPPDGAGIADFNADLSWKTGTRAKSHDVYFGTSSPPPLIRNQTSTTFDPGTMTKGAKYYWRIDEVGAYGTTLGTIWNFTVMTPPL